MRLQVLTLVFAAAASGCLPLFLDDDYERDCRGEKIASDVFDAQHCGFGDACAVCTDAPAHAAPACLRETTCGYQCAAGFADCNPSAADGCEQEIFSDVENCGGCGRPCHGECRLGICDAHWDGEGTVVAIDESAPPFTQGDALVLWLRTDGGTLDLRGFLDNRGTPGTLQSVPLAAGATPLLAQNYPYAYFTNGGAGDAGVLYSATGAQSLTVLAEGAVGGLLPSATSVYWTSPDTGELLLSDHGGGPARVVASGLGRPGPLVGDTKTLYWIDESRAAVMALSRDGGTPRTLSTQPFAPGPLGLTARVDSTETPTQQTFTDRSFPVWADLDAGVIWGAPDGVATPLTASDGRVFPAQLFSVFGLYVFDEARAKVAVPCDAEWPDGDAGLPLTLCDKFSYPPDVRLVSEGLRYFSDGGSIVYLVR